MGMKSNERVVFQSPTSFINANADQETFSPFAKSVDNIFNSYDIPQYTPRADNPQVDSSEDENNEVESSLCFSPPTLESDNLFSKHDSPKFDSASVLLPLADSVEKVDECREDVNLIMERIVAMDISKKKSFSSVKKLGVPIRNVMEGANVTVLTPVKASKAHKLGIYYL
jgi:hypothetical protein